MKNNFWGYRHLNIILFYGAFSLSLYFSLSFAIVLLFYFILFFLNLFSQGGPFSSEVDIQRGPGLKRRYKISL